MESVWSASKLSTESVGSRRELVANCVHTADATKQFRRVGGVYWALEFRTNPNYMITIPQRHRRTDRRMTCQTLLRCAQHRAVKTTTRPEMENNSTNTCISHIDLGYTHNTDSIDINVQQKLTTSGGSRICQGGPWRARGARA